jgi:predicted nuclease of predicted toxin-antitoxin system
MKIKLDENIPYSLIPTLSELGHDVDSVLLEGLKSEPDDVVWRATTGSGRFFITQDLDFSDIRKYRPGTHPGVLVVRLRHPGRVALAERIAEVFRKEDTSTFSGSFVVLTERKLRVRRREPVP